MQATQKKPQPHKLGYAKGGLIPPAYQADYDKANASSWKNAPLPNDHPIDYLQSVADRGLKALGANTRQREGDIMRGLQGQNKTLQGIGNVAEAPSKALMAGMQNTRLPDLMSTATASEKPGYRLGGLIKGKGTGTSDSINANLQAQGFIIPADVVKQYGVEFFNRLREKADPESQAENKAEGAEEVPAKVSNGEVYFTPEETKSIGMDFLNKLVASVQGHEPPKSGNSKFALGGAVDPMAQGLKDKERKRLYNIGLYGPDKVDENGDVIQGDNQPNTPQGSGYQAPQPGSTSAEPGGLTPASGGNITAPVENSDVNQPSLLNTDEEDKPGLAKGGLVRQHYPQGGEVTPKYDNNGRLIPNTAEPVVQPQAQWNPDYNAQKPAMDMSKIPSRPGVSPLMQQLGQNKFNPETADYQQLQYQTDNQNLRSRMNANRANYVEPTPQVRQALPEPGLLANLTGPGAISTQIADQILNDPNVSRGRNEAINFLKAKAGLGDVVGFGNGNQQQPYPNTVPSGSVGRYYLPPVQASSIQKPAATVSQVQPKLGTQPATQQAVVQPAKQEEPTIWNNWGQGYAPMKGNAPQVLNWGESKPTGTGEPGVDEGINYRLGANIANAQRLNQIWQGGNANLKAAEINQAALSPDNNAAKFAGERENAQLGAQAENYKADREFAAKQLENKLKSREQGALANPENPENPVLYNKFAGTEEEMQAQAQQKQQKAVFSTLYDAEKNPGKYSPTHLELIKAWLSVPANRSLYDKYKQQQAIQ